MNTAPELSILDGRPLHHRWVLRLEVAPTQTTEERVDLFGDRDEHVEVHVHGHPRWRVVAERQRTADGVREVLGTQGVREAPGKRGGIRCVGYFGSRQRARGAPLRDGESTAVRTPATASVHP